MLIADGQIHLWEKGTPSPPHRQEPYSGEQAIAAMDQAGVDRALIHPVLWDPDSNELAQTPPHGDSPCASLTLHGPKRLPVNDIADRRHRRDIETVETDITPEVDVVKSGADASVAVTGARHRLLRDRHVHRWR